MFEQQLIGVSGRLTPTGRETYHFPVAAHDANDHLGVMTDAPSITASLQLHQVQGYGAEDDNVHISATSTTRWRLLNDAPVITGSASLQSAHRYWIALSRDRCISAAPSTLRILPMATFKSMGR